MSTRRAFSGMGPRYETTVHASSTYAALTSGRVAGTLLPISDNMTSYGRRTGAVAETYSRLGVPVTNTASSLASGQLQFAAIALVAGQAITKITFVSGTTALSGGTHQWFALWNSSLARVAVTVDDTSTAWGSNAEKQLALAASATYTVPTDGLYYVSCMVAAGTPPTLLAITSATGVSGLAPVLAARDSTHTGLTDPASGPTPPTLTASAIYPYAWVG